MDRSQPIVVEQLLVVSRTRVWEAITDVRQMTQWFFDNIPDFLPEVGFETRFVVKSDERPFTHLWKIIEVESGSSIKYQWSYEECDGVGYVTFELIEKGDQTLIRLTNEGLESFPIDLPEFSYESCLGGWKYFINRNLRNFLNS